MLKSDCETMELNLHELPWYQHTDSTSEEEDDNGSSMDDDSDRGRRGRRRHGWMKTKMYSAAVHRNLGSSLANTTC